MSQRSSNRRPSLLYVTFDERGDDDKVQQELQALGAEWEVVRARDADVAGKSAPAGVSAAVLRLSDAAPDDAVEAAFRLCAALVNARSDLFVIILSIRVSCQPLLRYEACSTHGAHMVSHVLSQVVHEL